MRGLAEYISQNAPMYQELKVRNVTYINVRKGLDVVNAAQRFLACQGYRETGTRLKNMALLECNKLLRENILQTPDNTGHRMITADRNCYVYLHLPAGSSRRYRRRREH